MNELEKDILEFYKWLLVDKRENNHNSFIKYNTIVVLAHKIMRYHEIDQKEFLKTAYRLNYISGYFLLDRIFEIDTFANKYYTLDEIKFRRNKWYVPEIDKLDLH
jgi:hypothetical protein